MKLTVLLSSYNGEKYIKEQIDSILNQTLQNVSLLVRDDGSSDKTVEILKQYESCGKLKWYNGENLRCAKSFWNLVMNAEKSDYYAFCDQDDVWDADKLECAVNMLEKENPNTPLLYFCDVRVTDSELNVISENMVQVMPIRYPLSLVKNIAPGCTYVFNNATRELLKRLDFDKYEMDIHDWMVYRIVACFGKPIFDNRTHMNYRQHGNNEIGAHKKGIFEIIEVIKRFFNPKIENIRGRNARILEECYGDIMSKENLELTRLMSRYREDKNIKSRFLKSKDFKFKGIKYFYFKLLILLNKV